MSYREDARLHDEFVASEYDDPRRDPGRCCECGTKLVIPPAACPRCDPEIVAAVKHTPGPWIVERYLVDADGREVATTSSGNLEVRTRVVAGANSTVGPIVADMVAGSARDARLIAAAPDLLEALRRCNDAFAGWQIGAVPGRPEDILALIGETRAAIAKAEGR
jgi:hypothetical protein